MQGHLPWATPSTISVFLVILLYLVPARKNFFLSLNGMSQRQKQPPPPRKPRYKGIGSPGLFAGRAEISLNFHVTH